MGKKYLAKILARDTHGLKLISAHCFKAKTIISQIKYLKKNKIFIIFLERFLREKKSDEKALSVCKFEFVDNEKSKNIDQNNEKLVLELLTIELLKNEDKYEICLIFSNNAYITLSTEIVEATLEDQNNGI